MAKAKDNIVMVRCGECGGGQRRHKICREFSHNWGDEESIWGNSTYQICQCLGCDSVRFRIETRCSEDLDHETGRLEASVKIYPEVDPSRRQPMKEHDQVPEKVSHIYVETVQALNAGALTLAGGGLRAIVEAICHQQGMSSKKPLVKKIDELVSRNILAKPQADLLHEERYIGNAALHEIDAPSRRDVEDGLQIVETLLNTIYLAPMTAKRLKRRREQKKTSTSP